MTQVLIIRHGQANTGARDHDTYDNLSTLGHQQSKWLGEYFEFIGLAFDRVYSGNLRRQKDTAFSINQREVEHVIDKRLNEFDYFGLTEDLSERFGIPYPTNQNQFKVQIHTLLTYWKENKISSSIETFENFSQRILEIVTEISKQKEKALLVSSTGVIASLVADLLNVPMEERPNLLLSVSHTSLNRFERICGDLKPTLFCATPHLDRQDRAHARTFV